MPFQTKSNNLKAIIMKIRFLLFSLSLLLMGCSSVRVAVDYDTAVTFDQYTSFAFFKPSVDKMEVSDLDKKRILHAIDNNLSAKGLTKSKEAGLLVHVFTKEEKEVDVFQNNFSWGWGWGWSPWWNGGFFGPSVSTRTQGQLYINLVDAQTNQLLWQGKGTAQLYPNEKVEKKLLRIQKIVDKILAEYPPGAKE
jgi:hypothetical protein